MNKAVLEIARVNLRGNVIDHGWFDHITLKNGKPYMVAIAVLSEIVYWYKPAEIRDEETNEITYKQKFKADKLQKSYQQLADSFGFTKRQVKDACDYLKEKQLIDTEFRTVLIGNVPHSNVMFVEPISENIKKISKLYQDPVTTERKTLLHSNVRPSYDKTEEGGTSERKTYTKSSTGISTQNSTVKDNIPFKEIVSYLNVKTSTKYKPSSKKTKQLIAARFNEGFTLDDFKKVIDNKVAEWLNDSKMSQYLRPETLFGTKFESYLNQKESQKQNEVKTHAKSQYENLF